MVTPQEKPATLVNLRSLREANGISQAELALHLTNRSDKEVTRSAIDKWEAGERIPKLPAILAIADYFHVSVDYLLGRQEIPISPDDLRYSAEVLGLSLDAAKNLSQISARHGGQASEIVSDLLCSSGLPGFAEELYKAKAGIERVAKTIPADAPHRLAQQNRDLAEMYLLRAVKATAELLKEILGYQELLQEGDGDGKEKG